MAALEETARRAAVIFGTGGGGAAGGASWWWANAREDCVVVEGACRLLGHGELFGPRPEVTRAAALVHALQCADETARRATSHVAATLATEAGCIGYLAGVAKVLADKIEATRKARRDAAAAHAAMVAAVTVIAHTTTMAEFLNGLAAYVPNRSVPAFGLLVGLIAGDGAASHEAMVAVLSTVPDAGGVSTAGSSVPLAAQKAIVLATGHSVGRVGAAAAGAAAFGPVFSAVWCGGNVAQPAVVKRLREFVRQCRDPVFSADVLDAVIKSCRASYGRNDKNRHGHNDDFPSYYMMGYKTMDVFREAEPTEYAAYVALHRPYGCCGLRGIKPPKGAAKP